MNGLTRCCRTRFSRGLAIFSAAVTRQRDQDQTRVFGLARSRRASSKPSTPAAPSRIAILGRSCSIRSSAGRPLSAVVQANPARFSSSHSISRLSGLSSTTTMWAPACTAAAHAARVHPERPHAGRRRLVTARRNSLPWFPVAVGFDVAAVHGEQGTHQSQTKAEATGRAVQRAARLHEQINKSRACPLECRRSVAHANHVRDHRRAPGSSRTLPPRGVYLAALLAGHLQLLETWGSPST